MRVRTHPTQGYYLPELEGKYLPSVRGRVRGPRCCVEGILNIPGTEPYDARVSRTVPLRRV
jgi:hypothetical protein|uniref:Uncharacterized protein n=1 Tax=Picea glauca TaxID=3330 RepID=A0A101M4Y4_PICGL|nr:hypothetical protein ABT39_MTgene931 [Picea glauca]